MLTGMALRRVPGLLLAVFIVAAAAPEAGRAASDTAGDPAPPVEAREEPVAPSPPPVPDSERPAIEQVLRDKVAALLKEKNAAGASFRRGSYSKTFRATDDGAVQVAFHVDTAEEATLTTQRYMLTLERDPGKRGSWKIVSEDLRDTYSGAYRSTFEDVAYFRFDGFSFEGEGLRTTGGSGSLYRVHRNGRPEGFTLAAAGLSFEFTPPMERDRILYERLRKSHAQEILFEPDLLRVTCDPVTCERLLATAFTNLKPAGLEQLDPPLRKRHDEAAKEYRRSLTEDWFSGFWPLPEPDRRRWRLEFRREKTGADQRVAVEYDDFEPREVSYDVWGLNRNVPFWRTVYSYYSQETRSAGLAPAELERRDDQGRKDYDLITLEGTIEMALEDSETMVGDLVFGLRAKRPLRHLPFYIARLNPETADSKETKSPKMFVNSVREENGEELTFVKLGASYGLIVFPETVAAGRFIRLRVEFENRDSIYKLTPSYSYVSRGGWLPFVRFGDMIHGFDLTVKVPARYKTLGIGTKTAETEQDGVRITRWVPDRPVIFPTVIYGDYFEVESTVRATKSDGTPIPVWIHFDRTSMGEYGIAPKALTAFADEAAAALNLFRDVFGVDYPYDKLDLVNDPLPALYGQAPSSIVYLGSLGFFSKGRLGTMPGGRGDSNRARFTKSLVAHEVGHQWWGSLVTNANGGNYWFVESLAEYAAALYVEAAFGRQDYMEHLDLWRREVLNTDMKVSVQDASVLWGGDPGAYRAALYSKGPYVFHIMRSTWGDEKFFAFLKMLARELKGREIVTRDIQTVAERAFGGTMEWFFDQWLRGVGLPEYVFTYSTRQTEDGKYMVEGEIEQRIVIGRDTDPVEGEAFRAVVPITVTGRSGKEYTYRQLVEEERTRVQFKLPEEPREVVFNRNGEVLARSVTTSRR